jgi:hypothetical protein
MKVRFKKRFEGNYGVFPKGRKVELPPYMLATIPEEYYEECPDLSADSEITDKSEGSKNGRNETNQKAGKKLKTKRVHTLSYGQDSRRGSRHNK